jgi:hypothetical protein
MTFHSDTNATANFRDRLMAMRQILTEEGLTKVPYYSALNKLFGYEMAVGEETFSGVVVVCAKHQRLDLVDRLWNFLIKKEQGRLGIFLAQENALPALALVASRLPDYQFVSLVSTLVTAQHDHTFPILRPLLRPSLVQSEWLLRAAANNAEQFGRYFVEHGDVLQALRDIKSTSVNKTLVGWWTQAIAEGRVGVPDLGRSKTHWCKKFPELSSVLRGQSLDNALPAASVAPSKPRF